MISNLNNSQWSIFFLKTTKNGPTWPLTNSVDWWKNRKWTKFGLKVLICRLFVYSNGLVQPPSWLRPLGSCVHADVIFFCYENSCVFITKKFVSGALLLSKSQDQEILRDSPYWHTRATSPAYAGNSNLFIASALIRSMSCSSHTALKGSLLQKVSWIKRHANALSTGLQCVGWQKGWESVRSQLLILTN